MGWHHLNILPEHATLWPHGSNAVHQTQQLVQAIRQGNDYNFVPSVVNYFASAHLMLFYLDARKHSFFMLTHFPMHLQDSDNIRKNFPELKAE